MRAIDKLKIFYPLETWKDNKILRAWWEKVLDFDDDLSEFWNILLDLLWEYDGVWLAAPQIWENIAVIATTQRKRMPKWKNPEKDFIWETILVNPEIIEHSQEIQESEEACLSVPWEQWFVERYQWVIVDYQDVKW
jgi:peptide deformylase